MALGLLSAVRWQRPGWPRFVTAGLHRNVSVLACAVVVVHIVTTLADGFVPIYIQDAVLPFGSAYRPLWLGLGAVSFDLMLVLTVTSLVRTRMSYRAWRGPALDRVPVLAGRGRARPGHRHGHPGALGPAAHAGLRRGDRRASRLAAGLRMAAVDRPISFPGCCPAPPPR